MALYHPQNQYRGVNAHFQSFCQAENDWESFHGVYISDLLRAISISLPPGYIVKSERSLQIREFHPDTGESIITRKKPDLSLFTASPMASLATIPHAPEPTLTLAMEDTLPSDPAAYLRAITVYQALPDAIWGKPVTHIEILSPTNKPPHSGYLQYVSKREKLLHSGMNLVEVDFLHETESPLEGVPSYMQSHADSYPYLIAVNMPAYGVTNIYGFRVDEPLPPLWVPLAGEDGVEVDFGKIYSDTFGSVNSFSLVVDYEQLPLNFQRYASADQARIQAVMERVKK